MLGYDENPAALHLHVGHAGPSHPYSREIDALLNKNGDIRAAAVFDVDRVPTVCIIEAGDEVDAAWLAAVRQKIWNQSLVSLLFVVDKEKLTPYPAQKISSSIDNSLTMNDARKDGLFSARDIQSGNIQKHHAEWFALDSRVDRELLSNLHHGVLNLLKLGIDRDSAQFLLGQCLFVSYLEHREIVSDVYRTRRGVGQLKGLIADRDAIGLGKLFKCLKTIQKLLRIK